MANLAPEPSTRRHDEEPDVDQAPHPWLDDPNSPAYMGLCERCGQHHDTGQCPHVTAVVWSQRHRRARASSEAGGVR